MDAEQDVGCHVHRCSKCDRVFRNPANGDQCPQCGGLSNCALRGEPCS